MADLLSTLSPLDWCIVAMLAFGALSGLRAGFARLLLDTAPLLAAYLLSPLTPPFARAWLAANLPVPAIALPLVMDLCIWAGLYACIWLITRPLVPLARQAISQIKLVSAADHLLGACTGTARAALFLGLILAPFLLIPIPNPVDEAANQSVLAQPLDRLDHWAAAVVGLPSDWSGPQALLLALKAS